MSTPRRQAMLLLMLMPSLLACEEKVVGNIDMPPVPTPGSSTKAAAPADGDLDGGVGDAGPVVKKEVAYVDDDFVELDTEHRDPFRSYAEAFRFRQTASAQRRVLMPETSVDDMRLIAVVTGMTQPVAMLTDSDNVGHVVRRGDYLGRPEVIESGGSDGMPITLNWRVDTIGAAEVVLVREDPSAPDEPPLTRVIPLHEQETAQ